MPVDIFLVIPDPPAGLVKALPVPDPALDPYFSQTYRGAAAIVPLHSFNTSAVNPTTISSATGGAGAGKVKFNDLVIEKAVDRLSPSLLAIAASGSHFDKVQIFVRKPGGGAPQPGKPYLAYEFSMVFVTGIEWDESSGDEGPVEQVHLAYGGLTVGYFPQQPDGSLGKLTKLGWSQVTNTATGPDTLTTF
jgi:type VI secretion system secreted protein Hcp